MAIWISSSATKKKSDCRGEDKWGVHVRLGGGEGADSGYQLHLGGVSDRLNSTTSVYLVRGVKTTLKASTLTHAVYQTSKYSSELIHSFLRFIRRSRQAEMAQPHTGGLLSPPELSPLEQEVLEEYDRLATNMKTVRFHSIQSYTLHHFLSLNLEKTRQFQVIAQRMLTQRRVCTAGNSARRPSFKSNSRNPRWPAGTGAQDESRIHAAQGECVQHRIAARD